MKFGSCKVLYSMEGNTKFLSLGLIVILLFTAQIFIPAFSSAQPIVDGKLDAIYGGVFKTIVDPGPPQIGVNVYVYDNPSTDPTYIYFYVEQDVSINDNTYGDCADASWGTKGHTFKDLLNSDDMRFQLYDCNSSLIFDFTMDYLAKFKSSTSSQYPCGYKSGGLGGIEGLTQNDGALYTGQTSWLNQYATSLEYDLNNILCAVTNSPTCDTANNADWIIPMGYEFRVPRSIFGTAGFCDIIIADVHNSPEKNQSARLEICVSRDTDCDGQADADGNKGTGIKGIEITLTDLSTNIISIGTTGGNEGVAHFSGLSTGTYRVCITLPDGFILCPFGQETCQEISVGTSTSQLRFCFFAQSTATSGRIEVCKFEDRNRNGIQDVGEPSLSGVTIRLYLKPQAAMSRLQDQLIATLITDSTGCVVFTDLADGLYRVTEIVPKGWINILPTSTTLRINSDNRDNTVIFANARPSLIVCKFNDENGNGRWDPGEDPWSGVTVRVTHIASSTTWTCVTDTTGCVVFSRTSTGLFRITEVVPECSIPSTSTTTTVNVTSCADSTYHIEFGNFIPRIIVTKIEDLNGNGIVDEGELPWSGVTIGLISSSGVTTLLATDSVGRVIFDCLSKDTYTVFEIPPIGSTATKATTVQVYVNKPNTSIVFTNNRPRSIIVRKFRDLNCNGIKDSNEPFLSDVVFNLSQGGNLISTKTTDNTGTAVFSNISTGTYTLCEIVPVGFINTTDTCQNISVGTTSQSTTIFVGNQTGSIEACAFVDTNGNGIQNAGEPDLTGATICINGPGTSMDTCRLTAGDGCVTFNNLSEGDFNVCITVPNGYIPTTDTCRLLSLDGRNCFLSVKFGVQPPGEGGFGAITVLKFYDRNHNGIRESGDYAMSSVTFRLTGPGGTQQKTTNSSGIIVFTDLTTGTYTICELMPFGYVPTTFGGSSCTQVTLTSVNSTARLEFGNYIGRICSRVFYDLNCNGLINANEPLFGGVTIKVQGIDVSFSTTFVTSSTGIVCALYVPQGLYAIYPLNPPAGLAFTTYSVYTHNIFGNFQYLSSTSSPQGRARFGVSSTQLTVCKFNDLNGNKTWDQGEPPVEGVTIQIWNSSTTSIITSKSTDSTGCVVFSGLTSGSYLVKEVIPDGWTATTQSQVIVKFGQYHDCIQTVTFGNKRSTGIRK